MPYIHFTEEQKLRASSVDLPEFLRRQGEKLIRSGPEYRLSSDHSVTVRGNEWYDHASRQGGGPISFAQNYLGLSYPEAVTRLLDGEQGAAFAAAQERSTEPKKEFALPPANRDMRRMYAYLLKRRFLDREVVSAFVRTGLIYEDEKYHNAVFVGKDEHGVARHAHKRSVNSEGRAFRANVEGSDPRYSFHWTGTGDRLYVFEAPIDLLSFLSLYPKNWQRHSFVALCGTSEYAMVWMLEQNPNIQSVALCLDHDEAGIEASGRLADILCDRGCERIGVLQPEHKDWNEDLKGRRGLEAQPAEEHPQLIAAVPVCRRIASLMENAHPERLGKEVNLAVQGYRREFQAGRMDDAMGFMEQASALALFAYGREKRQMGKPMTATELEEQLRGRILPHRNRGSIQTRHSELAERVRDVLAKATAPGIRGEAEKQALAENWLELAVSLAKIPIKYDADRLKQQQKQEQHEMKMEAIMCSSM